MKITSILLLAILLISTASALNISDKSITNVIIPEFNQPAQFELTITEAQPGSYNIYTLTDVKIIPTAPFQIDSLTNSVDIYVYPTEQLEERGFYSFTYNLKTPTIEKIEDKLLIKIVDLKDAIEISSDSNDPSLNKISFYVRNKEQVELKNVKAKFSSIFFDFEETFDLKPSEKTRFNINVDKENPNVGKLLEEVKNLEKKGYNIGLLEAELFLLANKDWILGWLHEKRSYN